MIKLPKYWRKVSSLKTLDIKHLEWFDKANGNSYFACEVICNYGLKNQFSFNLPFQYGYGDHYFDMVAKQLIKIGVTSFNLYRWQDQQDSKVLIRRHTLPATSKELKEVK
jgi:hypothetical protein